MARISRESYFWKCKTLIYFPSPLLTSITSITFITDVDWKRIYYLKKCYVNLTNKFIFDRPLDLVGDDNSDEDEADDDYEDEEVDRSLVEYFVGWDFSTIMECVRALFSHKPIRADYVFESGLYRFGGKSYTVHMWCSRDRVFLMGKFDWRWRDNGNLHRQYKHDSVQLIYLFNPKTWAKLVLKQEFKFKFQITEHYSYPNTHYTINW